MPLETVTFVIKIGTHTDEMPLNGPGLCECLQKAVFEYRTRYGDPEHGITELESVDDPDRALADREVWNDRDGWVGK